jgi:uncharacterized protein
MTDRLIKLEALLEERLVEDEARLPRDKRRSSLFAHVVRVAAIARSLASEITAASTEDAYLVALLHDAGKFLGGEYHRGEVPEEEYSARVASELLEGCGFDAEQSGRIQAAILDLYREVEDPGLLTAIVHDADNLDKLGPHGVANFFVKSGLRGRGLDLDLVTRLSVELTYARHAEDVMMTEAGARRAAPLARQTEAWVRAFLDSLAAELGWELVAETLPFQDLEIVAVRPRTCHCGGDVSCSVACEESIKCTVVVLEQRCEECVHTRSLRFCCPRIRARRHIDEGG